MVNAKVMKRKSRIMIDNLFLDIDKLNYLHIVDNVRWQTIASISLKWKQLNKDTHMLDKNFEYVMHKE